jgi:glycolate oxidase FAD binding subunit
LGYVLVMAQAPLDALRAAVGHAARPAGDGDTVAGVPARYVAAPGTTGEAAAVVRAAVAHDLAVVVRGAGTKLDWGHPPRRLDLLLDTHRLAGVVEHVAGDMVAVVRAGTTLEALGDRLSAAGQQLALDRPLPGATVGGAVATGAGGPRRLLYGSVRDLLIGVTVVRPDGAVARAGGKVVKNVAGYDLGKLVTGSYGTLGLVTECVFRLHPLPRAALFVGRRAGDANEAGRLVAAVRAAQVVPSAVEVDAVPGAGIAVTVLLEGVRDGVVHRAATVATLLGGEVSTVDGPPDGWGAYPWGPGDVGIRLTCALSGVPSVLAAARQLAVRGSAGVGVLYAGLPGTTDPETVAGVVDELRAATAAAGGHCVVLTAPAAVRERVDLWGPVDGLDLMRRVKERFDPDARFAPGRFVGGI